VKHWEFEKQKRECLVKFDAVWPRCVEWLVGEWWPFVWSCLMIEAVWLKFVCVTPIILYISLWPIVVVNMYPSLILTESVLFRFIRNN
jgi:hypothetical protein